MLGFLKRLFGVSKPAVQETVQEAPYKVETPVVASSTPSVQPQVSVSVAKEESNVEKVTARKKTSKTESVDSAKKKEAKPKKVKASAMTAAEKPAKEAKPKAPKKPKNLKVAK